MAWTKPGDYSKSKVDWAGDTLSNRPTDPKKHNEALEILTNWRAIHSYPLHVFKQRLKRVSEKVDEDALVVQRLKRLPSILKKLQRRYHGNEPTMKLSQMQDIAGCRAVVSNVKLARQLYKEHYIHGDLKHKKVNEKDYISSPKDDGYRSIHLIYRYNTDRKGKKEYNGLLVEVQIRSKLQHLWATAIETVDFFTRQAIKSNEGQKEWMDFFKLVSSAFALMEKTPPVPNTPTNKHELFAKIKEKEKELNVIRIMSGWTRAIKVFRDVDREHTGLKYFLLEMDIAGEKLNISGYTEDQAEIALANYAKAEKRNEGKKEFDVVLVGADASKDLEKAYPNYFADTKEFLVDLQKILNKAK